jgi:hypothetical protein
MVVLEHWQQPKTCLESNPRLCPGTPHLNSALGFEGRNRHAFLALANEKRVASITREGKLALRSAVPPEVPNFQRRNHKALILRCLVFSEICLFRYYIYGNMMFGLLEVNYPVNSIALEVAVSCGCVSKVRWTEVKEQVMAVNKGLGSYLDEIDGQLSKADLYVARYDYGKLMVNRGRFSTPCDVDPCEECKALSSSVGYSCIPFALLLERCVEVFLDYGMEEYCDNGHPPEEELRLVPLRLLGAGEVFGVFELLDSVLNGRIVQPPWSVSAGTRSVWIVAPMGDERIHNSIRKKTGVRWGERTRPHWKLIAALERSTWQVSVLIFPDWILKAAAESTALRLFLLETGWKQSTNLRQSSLSDANLQTSFLKQYIKAPLGELYQYATIRHILDIATGVAPAFQPAARAKIPGGPFSEVEAKLRDMLKDIAKNYQPIVLQPGHLSQAGDVGYYSFRCPSVPGPKLPKVTNYADIPGTVHEVLKFLRKNPDLPLDFGKTTFFARSGDYSVENHADYLPMDEFFSPKPEKLKAHGEVYLNSPFFVAGARIVRAGVPIDRVFSKAASA